MGSSPSSPAKSERAVHDLAGEEFWDQWWERSGLPPTIDPYGGGLKNYPFRKFHQYFENAFRVSPTRGKKLMEIGAAQSVVLPYFAKYFGFDVCGLDRSKLGCERARTALERENVKGRIYCADLFSPPTELLGSFDVVCSFGVVEHFENTAECLKAMGRFLSPGGTMITVIPNMLGINGKLQKIMDRSIYDAHVLLERDGLASAHRDAGLAVESCEYFLPISLENVNVTRWPNRLAYFIVIRTHGVISRFVWLVDKYLPIRPNRWSSPDINCVARKPRAQSCQQLGEVERPS